MLATLSRREEGLVGWEGSARDSILAVKQNTLLTPALGGDGSSLDVCSTTIQLVSLIAPLWMKTTYFAETFDKTN